ncbi:hypothetical protein [Streptomyces sp. KR80]|uniref:hypothetical protein n=1 Tax=Streptomyces sp. KR80 TaxID=3457426 RepID=UPI003FCF5FC7
MEWWQVVIVAVGLLFLIVGGFSGWRRRSRPEEQRIAEAEQRFFVEAGPSVEIDSTEANLKSEPLTHLALQHGYELDRTEQRRVGYFRTLKYHFVFRGPDAKPAPYLPESPQYGAYMRWEARQRQRTLRIAVVVWLILAVLVGATVVRILV